MPWRSRRYDRTSVPDIRHSTVGQFAPIPAIHGTWTLSLKRTSAGWTLLPAQGDLLMFTADGAYVRAFRSASFASNSAVDLRPRHAAQRPMQ